MGNGEWGTVGRVEIPFPLLLGTKAWIANFLKAESFMDFIEIKLPRLEDLGHWTEQVVNCCLNYTRRSLRSHLSEWRHKSTPDECLHRLVLGTPGVILRDRDRLPTTQAPAELSNARLLPLRTLMRSKNAANDGA